MNKILRMALAGMFHESRVSAVIEVINATRNPVGAAEKLLGVFEEPTLLMYWRPEDLMKSRKLIGYEWNAEEDNQVRYEYQTSETTIRYLGPDDQLVFDKGFETDAEAVSFLNRNGKYRPDGLEGWYERRHTRIATHSSSCSVKDWQQYQSVE